MQKKDLLVVAIIVIAAIVLGAICGKLLLDNVNSTFVIGFANVYCVSRLTIDLLKCGSSSFTGSHRKQDGDDKSRTFVRYPIPSFSKRDVYFWY